MMVGGPAKRWACARWMGEEMYGITDQWEHAQQWWEVRQRATTWA